MTERDYIDATTLAKVRIGLNVSCDNAFHYGGEMREDFKMAAQALSRIIERLEEKVKCR